MGGSGRGERGERVVYVPDLVTREKLFRIYRENMINQQTPWIGIGGTTTERTAHGIAAVKRLLSLQ